MTIIEQALAAAKAPCITSSFQAECVVLTHMLQQHQPHIPVLFLDTFHHFPETGRYRDELSERWKLNLVIVRAQEPAPGLWRESTTLCCARHKVEPLFSALTSHDVWFSGLRRDQSSTRTGLRPVDTFRLPSGHCLRKVSPLADWTSERIHDYVREHDIPLLPLYERGYLSIGCEPCTAIQTDPANPRSGRWQGEKLECGIHVQASDASS